MDLTVKSRIKKGNLMLFTVILYITHWEKRTKLKTRSNK